MRRLFASVAVLAAVAAGPAFADPSATCDTGVVPPSTTPAGSGVRLVTEPLEATATVCVTGTVAPVPGHAKASADATKPSILVVVDGDPAAAGGCTDGYTGASAGGGGVSLYHNADGGHTSRSRPRSPTEIADSVTKYCGPAPSV